ncbi:ATP-binding protein [Geminicoccaceae bacterium 1502E]|nr:ATP-binding protein [Geminicoccaceae bacterium 1502E]
MSAGGGTNWRHVGSRLLGWLRTRLRGRPDTEHEQALVRIGFAVLIAVYILFLPGDLPGREKIVAQGLTISLVCLLASIGIFLHILARPDTNPRRRYMGVLVDTAGVNGVMLVGGMATAPFYPVLLWIILGHGFRFGRPYLAASAGCSLVFFAAVVTLNAEWHALPALDVALLIALVLLPLYFSVLLSKLTDAIARAEEANRAKSRFLASMSHELRTPLNAILGMGDLLGTTRLDTEQRDMTATIRSAARTLLAQVDDLLDIAKIEARRYTLESRPFDLHARLVLVRSMLQHQATSKELYLRLRLDPETPFRLVGGVQPLHQILVNLTANAIKFTSEGGVLINVRLLSRGDDEARLLIEVQDTGIGIPTEKQRRIFERFSQAEEDTHRIYGGTGLGLNIAQELAELMGGRIGVRSEPGKGSCFWVELPFALDTTPTAREPLSGTVLLLGPPAACGKLAQRVRALGARTVAASDTDDLLSRLHVLAGRHAVALIGPEAASRAAAVAARLAAEFAAEPIDLLTFDAGESRPAQALADLDSDVGEEALYTALRAAMARDPAGSGARGGEAADREDEPELLRAALPGQVLLADDNRVNQRVIGAILEHAGHTVTVVGTGIDAVERIESERFDIVLMDLSMPGMGGIEAVKMLRFTCDADELPPIVALSADATPEARAECASVGFVDYLTKPVDSQLLLSTMDALVAARRGVAVPQLEAPAGAAPEPQPESFTPTVPILDRRRLDDLARLDQGTGFIAELIDEFLHDAEEIIGRMDAAAGSADARVLRDQAHALRSSAAHMGARALFEITIGWRTIDDAALIMRAPTEIRRLDSELERLRAALHQAKKELPPAPGGGAPAG